jgi:hypothetical protein
MIETTSHERTKSRGHGIAVARPVESMAHLLENPVETTQGLSGGALAPPRWSRGPQGAHALAACRHAV